MNARQRLIEWWCLLNCHVRPADLPPEESEETTFRQLTAALGFHERLDFWNGAFKHGLNSERFRSPSRMTSR